MPERPLNELIQQYLDETISAAEFSELQTRIGADPAAADEFARACRMDALLAEHFEDVQQTVNSSNLAQRAVDELRAVDDYLPVAPKRRRVGTWAWATAAVLLIATGIGVWFALPTNQPLPPERAIAQNVHRLLSGRVTIDGEETQSLQDGSRFEVLDEHAIVAFADGSQAEFAPDSTAVIRGPVGNVRQVIALTRGSGAFRVEKGNRQFRVETPLGDVAVLGTEFAVHLQELNSDEGDDEMMMRSFLTLAVAVTVGQVEVQINGRNYLLGAGQSQVFADERPAKVEPTNFDRAADLTTRLLNYDEKAGTMLVAGTERKPDVTFAVAKDVKVFAPKPDVKLADIPANQMIMLYLNEDKSTILAVRVGDKGAVRGGEVGRREDGSIRAQIAEVDVAKNTITIKRERQSMVFTLSDDAKIFVDGKPAKLADVKADAIAGFSLNDDKKVTVLKVGGMDGDGEKPVRRDGQGQVNGQFLSYDEKANTIVVEKGERGSGQVTFNVAKEIRVSIDDKPAKLSDIQPETAVALLLSEDKTTVIALRVDASKPGRRLIGSVNAEKNTVNFKTEGADLVFPVAADAKIIIDGKPAKLADIKGDVGATVWYSADKSTVTSIQIGKGGVRRPDGDKPVERRPDGDKPVERKPDGDKPVERKPDGDKPVERKPDGEKPVQRKPDGEK